MSTWSDNDTGKQRQREIPAPRHTWPDSHETEKEEGCLDCQHFHDQHYINDEICKIAGQYIDNKRQSHDIKTDKWRAPIGCKSFVAYQRKKKPTAVHRHTTGEKDLHSATLQQHKKFFGETLSSFIQEKFSSNREFLFWVARAVLRMKNHELEVFRLHYTGVYRIAKAADARISGIPHVKRQVQKKSFCSACKTYGPHKDGRCLFCGESSKKDRRN
jgi:hypothetical protein